MSRKGSFGLPSEISRSATNIGYSSNEKLAFKPTFGSQRSAINAHNYYSISGINGMQEDEDVVDDDSDGDIFVPNGAATFSDYSRENSTASHVPYIASVSVTSADGTGDREEVSVDDLQSDVQARLVAMEKRMQLQEEEICILKSALSNALTRIQALEQGKPAMNTILPSRPPYKSTPKPTHPAVQRSYDSGGGPKKAQSMDVMVSAGKLTESPAPTPSRSSDAHRLSTTSSASTVTSSRGDSASTSSRASSRQSPNSSLTAGTASSVTPAAAPSPIKRWSSMLPGGDGADGSTSSRGLSSSLSSLRDTPKPVRQPARYREPSYDADDKCLRFHLRGRALNLYAPTAVSDDYQLGQPLAAPSQRLKLEWVYGYRGKDARSNLYQLPTGEIIYFAAAVVVLYNAEEKMQRHYLGHTDDVKCLAVHPDRITIATGQAAGVERKDPKRRQSLENVEKLEYRPHIRIWDSVSLATLRIIGTGDFDRAVSCLAFSKADGGTYLVAVDEAPEHVISLWDWAKGDKGHKVTETKSSLDAVLGIEFHPIEKYTIVTFGRGHLTFWNMEGQVLTRKAGVFEKHEKPKYITCVAFADNGDTLSGDSSGHLYVWQRGANRIVHAVTNIHEGGILSLCVMKDGTLLTSGRDRRIVQWTSAYKKTGQETQLAEQFGSIRMLSQGRGNMVLVGTTRNFILHGSLHFQFSVIMQGHLDEVWGLASHPSQHQFVTASTDGRVNLWDALTHTVVWGFDLPAQVAAYCAGFSADGSMVAVGGNGGRWVVVDVSTREELIQHVDGTESIAVVGFSPNGGYIAIGSHDNAVYLYTVAQATRKFTRVGKCQGHSSAVLHLDWSADSQFIRTNSADYELLFWNATNCQQIKSSSSLRDVEWASQSCTISFDTCGIWPEGADGTDINSVASANKRHLVATGDDSGRVTIYRYPCNQPKCVGNAYAGHSSHVMNVSFVHDDSRLVSVGGKDMSVMQWAVIG